MQVLLIDGYSTTKAGRAARASFRRIITNALDESCKEKHDIIERRIDNLRDYICDWEHDVLDEVSKNKCLKFDKIDLICIGGDMKTCPWDPLFSHAITLLHMVLKAYDNEKKDFTVC